ncbi:MAG: 30S ribosome-binding factor RbfA [Spirochaetales bacterium]|uniref:Ribosome-binding factor A n=1 Tax=Candidatus Thalassospirochaeta sargassi TaxID=3119039 RepID=A0AAJ1IEH8_9SPIO|nr:30S ribosome-binding factor RbfA [Spirochaetales bacterium]
MSEFRMQRIDNMVREAISEMIMRGTVKDPRISKLVSISKVDVSKDLSFARIYISGIESERKIKSSVDGLNSAAGFIQKNLGKKMHTRTTPKLKFIFDSSIKDGFEMTKKLESMHIEPAPPEESDD